MVWTYDAQTYPRVGNGLGGLPIRKAGSEFNKILDIQVIPFSVSTGGASLPITIKFDNWSELDIFVRVTSANGPSTLYGSEKEFTHIPTPIAVVPTRLLYGSSGNVFSVSTGGSPTNNPTVELTGSTNAVIGIIQVMRRKRKVKNFGFINPAASSTAELPFAIVDPTKTWLGPAGTNTAVSHGRIGNFLNSYFSAGESFAWHITGLLAGSVDGVKVIGPTTVMAGSSATPQQVFVLEFE